MRIYISRNSATHFDLGFYLIGNSNGPISMPWSHTWAVVGSWSSSSSWRP